MNLYGRKLNSTVWTFDKLLHFGEEKVFELAGEITGFIFLIQFSLQTFFGKFFNYFSLLSRNFRLTSTLRRPCFFSFSSFVKVSVRKFNIAHLNATLKIIRQDIFHRHHWKTDCPTLFIVFFKWTISNAYTFSNANTLITFKCTYFHNKQKIMAKLMKILINSSYISFEQWLSVWGRYFIGPYLPCLQVFKFTSQIWPSFKIFPVPRAMLTLLLFPREWPETSKKGEQEFLSFLFFL